MRVYLSGPMTGYEDYNFPAFQFAAFVLRSYGLEVSNPAEHFGGRVDLPREVYMREDIEELLDADVVVVLPGWNQSRGALLEVAIAHELGLCVFTEGGELVTPESLQRSVEPPLTTNETPRASILEEAQGLIYGDRQAQYGHPYEDFSRTGRLWAAILGLFEVTPEQVGLCMAALKMSRAVEDHEHGRPIKRDTLVDLAGYAGTVELVQEYAVGR